MAFFDPTRPSYRADPYPSLARLRKEDPVHRSPGLQAWVLTQFEDCAEVLREGGRFTADPTRTAGPRADFIRAHREATPLGTSPTLSTTSGEEHKLLRRIVNPCFAPAAVRKHAPRIDAIVDDLLGAIPPGEPVELMTSFANSLPKQVMLGVMGFPADDGDRLQRLCQAIEVTRSNPRAGSIAGATSAHAELTALVESYVETGAPEETVLGALAAAHAEGLGIDHIVSVAAHIATVGSDPTTGAIANSVVTLATHPEALQTLRQVPERLRMAAHELLRFDSPTHLVPRFAVDDTELGSRRIRRGEAVLAVVGAANRDPAVFDRPDELDIGRDARRQLGFGQGEHICLGAPLALAILEAALAGLLERFGRMELLTPPEHGANVELRVPDRVVVRFS